MKLREITFPNIVYASGTWGFFMPALFFCHAGLCVHQTITVLPYELQEKKIPKTFKNFWIPRSTRSKLGAGVVVVHENISNAGLESLLCRGLLQKYAHPFLISIAFVGVSQAERIVEAQTIVAIIQKRKNEFISGFGIVLCLSEIGDIDYDIFVKEVSEIIAILFVLGIPIILQVSLSFPPDMIAKVVEGNMCDAIMLRTSVVWSGLSDEVKNVFFQTKNSPIRASDGYVFGKYISPLAIEWTRQAKKYTAGVPLVVGGGILSPDVIERFVEVGANAIVLDRAIRLRFWNIGRIVRRIRLLLK